MIFKYLFIAFFGCLICFSTNAQQVDQESVLKELRKRGVDEVEVKKRLIEQGYDPDNIDLNNPSELIAIQAAADKIVAEIQAENLQLNKESKIETLPVDTKIESVLPVTKDSINDVPLQEKDKLPKPNIYGQHLYRNGAIKFYKKSEYIKPTQNYILGPGDKVTVAIWGTSEENFNQEISADGFVKFDRIPRIYISGLKLSDAKEAIRAKLRNNYPFNPDNFEVTVSATRNINVSISGDVFSPGTYNISALNSAVNALAAAGGPTDIGSVRNIQLVKSDGSKQTIDLYKFLNDPSVGQNYQLSDNDFIIVPVAKKVVGIQGAINRAYKYELLSNENLGDLIEYAGGLKVEALKKNISITRFENDKRVILNADLTSIGNGLKFQLLNGDIINISDIDGVIKNEIIVEGALENAGSFALTPNMKLSELVSKMILKEDALLDVAYLLRLNDDRKTVRYEIIDIQVSIDNKGAEKDISLQAGDRLIIRAKSEFVNKNIFEIKGAVRKSGTYDLDSDTDLKISDAIYLSGGLTEIATNFAYIIRRPPGSLSPEYISIDIKNAIASPNSVDNINLVPNDIIHVYDQSSFFDKAFVSIQGAVRNPREFEYDPSLSLKDVILQAGGLTFQASSNKIDIFRIEFQNKNKTRTLVANASVDSDLNIDSGGDFQLQPYDQIVVRTAPEFEMQRAVIITGEVIYPGVFFLVDDNSTLIDVISEAGGLTKEAFSGGATLFRQKDDVGYIIIDLDEAISNPKSTINVILQEGDKIVIPKKNNLVSVTGAINTDIAFSSEIANRKKTNFVYEKGKNAKYYIHNSGGFDDNADKSDVTVIYPNGEKHKVKKVLFFKNYPEVVPGSTIVVGYKKEEIKSGESTKEDIDWGKILSNSIAQATAILSLILLIQNVD